MKTFIYSFRGYNPVGAFMYIRTKDQEDANKMFLDELPSDLLYKNTLANGDIDASAVHITKIKPGKSSHIISNGDY